MKKTRNNQYEQLHDFMTQINVIVKSNILKKEIAEKLISCLENGTFFIDGNVLGGNTSKESNDYITLVVDDIPTEPKAFNKIKYTYTGEKTHKEIEYINYYDDYYSINEEKEVKVNNEKKIIFLERLFSSNGLEVSRKVHIREEKRESENYESIEQTMIYHRIGNRITKNQETIKYRDTLNDELNQNTDYENNIHYYSAVSLKNEPFGKLIYSEIDQATYAHYLIKAPVRTLKI